MSAEDLRAKIREIPDFPKPGILFYDITTLLKDAGAFKEPIDLMTAPFARREGRPRRGHGIARLHLLRAHGHRARRRLRAGPQAGQAAGRDRVSVEYALEYGTNTLEIHKDAIMPGQRVLIVDDLLATGGTVSARSSC